MMRICDDEIASDDGDDGNPCGQRDDGDDGASGVGNPSLGPVRKTFEILQR